jgi:hypothetical protein
MEIGNQVWAVVKNHNSKTLPWQLKLVTISLVLENGKFQIKWNIKSCINCGNAVYPESRLYTKKPSYDQIAKNSDEPNGVQTQFSEAEAAARNKSKYKYQIKY